MLYMCCRILFLGEPSAVCITPLVESTWEFVPGFSADFNLYLFTVVNHTVDIRVFLSSMSPFTELLKLRVVLGTLDHTHLHTLFGNQIWQFCPAHKAILMLAPLKGRTTETWCPSSRPWPHRECQWVTDQASLSERCWKTGRESLTYRLTPSLPVILLPASEKWQLSKSH